MKYRETKYDDLTVSYVVILEVSDYVGFDVRYKVVKKGTPGTTESGTKHLWSNRAANLAFDAQVKRVETIAHG